MQFGSVIRPRIALVGEFGSGKTHMAQYMVDNFGYTKYSFATSLKIVARDYYGATLSVKNRSLLQQIGDAMRSVNQDVFANKTLKQIDIFQSNRVEPWRPVKTVVIDDLRFNNEYALLKQREWYVVRILPREPLQYQPERDHQSETEQINMVVDAEITSGDYESLNNILYQE